MFERLWILRVVFSLSLIVTAWVFLFLTYSWAVSLLLVSYILVIGLTEWDAYEYIHTQDNAPSTKIEDNIFWPLKDNGLFIGSKEEYEEFLKLQQQEEINGKTKRPEDEV